MLKDIAHGLSYVGMVLVVETVTQKRSWAATAIFTSRQVLYGLGATPNAALKALVTSALGDKLQSAQETPSCLDSIAKDCCNWSCVELNARPT